MKVDQSLGTIALSFFALLMNSMIPLVMMFLSMSSRSLSMSCHDWEDQLILLKFVWTVQKTNDAAEDYPRRTIVKARCVALSSNLYQIVDRLSNGMITDIQLIKRSTDVRQVVVRHFLFVRLKRIERSRMNPTARQDILDGSISTALIFLAEDGTWDETRLLFIGSSTDRF